MQEPFIKSVGISTERAIAERLMLELGRDPSEFRDRDIYVMLVAQILEEERLAAAEQLRELQRFPHKLLLSLTELSLAVSKALQAVTTGSGDAEVVLEAVQQSAAELRVTSAEYVLDKHSAKHVLDIGPQRVWHAKDFTNDTRAVSLHTTFANEPVSTTTLPRYVVLGLYEAGQLLGVFSAETFVLSQIKPGDRFCVTQAQADTALKGVDLRQYLTVERIEGLMIHVSPREAPRPAN